MEADKMTTASIRALERALREGKRDAEDIAVLTAYDATFARLFDAAKVDVLLLGDTLGMGVQGASNTLGATLDDVIYHTRTVTRGASRALIVADMPFMNHPVSPEQACQASGPKARE